MLWEMRLNPYCQKNLTLSSGIGASSTQMTSHDVLWQISRLLTKRASISVVDVKTHREDTRFNMPNLTSVERFARFYESDSNIFSVIVIKYAIERTKVTATEVTFGPIEFLNWECLTVGALGWGQIQISDSNNIKLIDGYSRKEWMLQLCDTLFEFYPKEIVKIQERMGRFDEVKTYWESREEIWC